MKPLTNGKKVQFNKRIAISVFDYAAIVCRLLVITLTLTLTSTPVVNAVFRNS